VEPSGWNPIGTNHALYEHENTKNKAIRGYWHKNLIKEKVAVSVYEKADGSFLTKEEITELYTFFSKSDSNKHDLEDQVEVRNYNIEKLKFFKNGEFEYNDLSEETLKKLGLR